MLISVVSNKNYINGIFLTMSRSNIIGVKKMQNLGTPPGGGVELGGVGIFT